MFISAPLTGIFAGGIVMVMCWSVPTVIGSVLLLRAFHQANKILILPFFNYNILQLCVGLIAAISINQYLNKVYLVNFSNIVIFSINLLTMVICISYPLFSNKTFSKVLSKIGKPLLRKP
jgi:hypothetical protein